jgi:hypothetical protein
MRNPAARDPTQAQQESKRDKRQHGGQRQRCPQIAFHGLTDRQRHGLCATDEVPRKQNCRAELAQRACPAQDDARQQRRPGQWKCHMAKDMPITCAQIAGAFFDLARHAHEAGLRRSDEEGRGDEDLRHDHRDRRKRQIDA